MHLEPGKDFQELRAISALTICFVKALEETNPDFAPAFMRQAASLYDGLRGENRPDPWLLTLKSVHDALSYPGELRSGRTNLGFPPSPE